MSEVIWKPCAGIESYEVSSDGRVRSIDRIVPRSDGIKHFCRGRELKFWLVRGYRSVHLVNGRSARRKTYVHTLVCEAFHGLRPSPIHQVRHLNGDRNDNRAENLTWGTQSENNRDMVRHGRHPYAKRETCPRGHRYDVAWGRTKRQRCCSKCSRASANAASERIRQRIAAAAVVMGGSPRTLSWQLVDCPKCGQPEGERCRTGNKGRLCDPHIPRIDAAIDIVTSAPTDGARRIQAAKARENL